MAFKLSRENTFTMNVPVSTPVDDKVEEWSFKAKCRVAAEDDLKGTKNPL